MDLDGRNIEQHERWDAELERWRERFSFLRSGRIHMASCSQSPVADDVRRAVGNYMDSLTEKGMDWETWLGEVEAAKAEFARLINADPEEIAVAASASAAIASVAGALDFQGRRRKVVTSKLDFPTVPYVWHGFEKYGAVLDIVASVEEYEARIGDDTVIVSIAHANYETGELQDVAAIGELVRAKGALLLVDAYQSVGVEPIDVQELQIDVLVTGASKYLLGVPGIAFLYVRRDLADAWRPAVTGWMGQIDPFRFPTDGLAPAAGSRRFEIGTPPVAAAYAARAGIRIVNTIGIERIARHGRMLSETAIALADEYGLELASPRDPSRKTPLTAIRTPGMAPGDVANALLRRGIVAAPRERVLRIAPHFFSTPEELRHVFAVTAEVVQASRRL